MDFSFLCAPAEAMKQFGLAGSVLVVASVLIAGYFQKGNAIIGGLAIVALVIVGLSNLDTILGWTGATMACTGL